MLIPVIEKQILLLFISYEDLAEPVNATSSSCNIKVCNSLITIVYIAYIIYMCCIVMLLTLLCVGTK